MKKYIAETKKDYLVNGNLVSAKTKIAYNIDCNWSHSAYWEYDTWVEQAKEDCIHRIDQVKEELDGLYDSMKLLEEIETLTGDENEQIKI